MKPTPLAALPHRPVGLGLRAPHRAEVFRDKPAVDFFEIHPENYVLDRVALRDIEQLRADYPLSLHGVGLSLGSADGLDKDHLAQLRALANKLAPVLVSDHLSWSVSDSIYLNDLLPLPYTKESLEIVARNIETAQETLQRQILIENPSAYLQFEDNNLSEPEFLRALVARTGCGLLLDVNNVFVSANNLGFDAGAYLDAFPFDAVQEIHLSGHHRAEIDGAIVLIDDHGSKVTASVWKLYADVMRRLRAVATLIEWDSNIPDFRTLLMERDRARAVATDVDKPPSRTTLHQLQKKMTDALIGYDEPTSALPIAGHFSIYRNNVRHSLTEALKTVFPAVSALVGEAFFAQCAHRFIEINPPRAPYVAGYGADFPEFLSALQACASVPYIADVARLEWAASRSALRSREASLSPEQLSARAHDNAEQLCFTAQPDVSYLASSFPIDLIWTFARESGEGAAPELNDAAFLEITRDTDGVALRRLEKAEFEFRRRLARGADLALAARAALTEDPLFDLPVALRSALRDGIFADCHVGPSTFEESPSCPC